MKYFRRQMEFRWMEQIPCILHIPPRISVWECTLRSEFVPRRIWRKKWRKSPCRLGYTGWLNYQINHYIITWLLFLIIINYSLFVSYHLLFGHYCFSKIINYLFRVQLYQKWYGELFLGKNLNLMTHMNNLRRS